MADFIFGGAPYGAQFELVGENSVLPSFLPYFNTLERPPGEYREYYSAFDHGDGISVGTVGARSHSYEPWYFRNYNATSITPDNLGTYLRNVLLSVGCPFFYNGNRLEWFSRFNTKFKADPFRALMPEAPSLSIDFGDVITAFEVDADVSPPVVTSVTKERSSIVFNVVKKGTGEAIPDGTVFPTGTLVARLDADYYGTITFNGIYNRGFSYDPSTQQTTAYRLPNFLRRWNFSSALQIYPIT